MTLTITIQLCLIILHSNDNFICIAPVNHSYKVLCIKVKVAHTIKIGAMEIRNIEVNIIKCGTWDLTKQVYIVSLLQIISNVAL